MTPTSTTGISDALPDSAPVCVRCVRLQEALREVEKLAGDDAGEVTWAIYKVVRAALAAVGEGEKQQSGDGSAVVVEGGEA